MGLIKIYLNWLMFPLAFTCWYLDLKFNSLSEGLEEDYLFWHEDEYRDMGGKNRPFDI